MKIKTLILFMAVASAVSGEVLVVSEDAMISQSQPDSSVVVSGVLRAARDPEGAGEQIYLKFDASSLSGAVTQIESFSGYALRAKYPRGSAVYLVPDAGVWSAATLTWNNAPGNDRTSGARMDADKVVKLGAFPAVPPKTESSVEFEWDSDAVRQSLIDALNTADRIVTLAVVRPTAKAAKYASLKNMDRGTHPFQLSVSVK